MAARHDDQLGQAVAESEREIFADVFKPGADEDNGADRSLEEMGTGLEGQHEPDEGEQEATAGDVEVQSSASKEGDASRDEQGRFKATDGGEQQGRKPDNRVPLGELKSEREKRQAAEAERDTLKADREASQRALADMNAKYDALERRITQGQQQPQSPQQQQPKEDPPPDFYTDPQAYFAWKDRQDEQRWAKREEAREQAARYERGRMSLQLAEIKHGETFKKAQQAFDALDARSPGYQQLAQQVMNTPDPGEFVVNWYRQQEAMQRYQSDPDGSKAREEMRKQLASDPEFRKQMLAEMQAEARGGQATATNGGTPHHQVRLPPSLSEAGGRARGSADEFDDSDKAMFGFALRS